MGSQQIDKELAEALASLEAEKEAALKDLNSQVTTSSPLLLSMTAKVIV